MPRYVIERQYLVPVFEHIFVEAPHLEAACREALDDDAQPWGDDAKLDFDTVRPTTVAQAVEIPEHLFPELRSREDGDSHDFSQILYESGLDLLLIPREFAERDDAQSGEPIGFA